MSVLKTYAEWVTVLEKFASGDDTCVEVIHAGKFVPDSGTAERFYQKVEHCYRKRKQLWLDSFNRTFQLQMIRRTEDFGIAVRNANTNLLPLLKFISAEGLPENARDTLKKDMEAFLVSIRKSCKENMSKSSPLNENMLMHINHLGFVDTLNKPVIHSSNSTHPITTPSTGRKILF